jgi:hypothetical protein
MVRITQEKASKASGIAIGTSKQTTNITIIILLFYASRYLPSLPILPSDGLDLSRNVAFFWWDWSLNSG